MSEHFDIDIDWYEYHYPSDRSLWGKFYENDNSYVTGTGQRLVLIHARTADCDTYGCVIHRPTDPHADWSTHWRDDRGLMERLCPEHGVGHPDFNAIEFIRRTRGDEMAWVESIHGCCGCCGRRS